MLSILLPLHTEPASYLTLQITQSESCGAWIAQYSALLNAVETLKTGSYMQQCVLIVHQADCSPAGKAGPEAPCPPPPDVPNPSDSARSARSDIGPDVASGKGMQILLQPDEALGASGLQAEARAFAMGKLVEPAFISLSMWRHALRHHLPTATPMYATCRLPQQRQALLVYGTNTCTIHLVSLSFILLTSLPASASLVLLRTLCQQVHQNGKLPMLALA